MTLGLTARLVYLYKFTLLANTKCRNQPYRRDYKAKFTEVKVCDMLICQACSQAFMNLLHNPEHVVLLISRAGQPQENKIFRFLKIYKKIKFLFSQKLA